MIITDEVVEVLAQSCGPETMALLLDRRGEEVKITEKVVIAAAESYYSSTAMITLLLNR